MNKKELLKQADKNLAANIMHRNTHAVNANGEQTKDYILYTLGVEVLDGHLNGALCLNTIDSEIFLNEVDTFFMNQEQRGYVIWVRDHQDQDLEALLKAKGHKPVREPGSAGMVIYNPIEVQELPQGFVIKQVTDHQSQKDYAQVIGKAFNKTQHVVKNMFSNPKITNADNVKAYVVYHEYKPVAGTTIVLTGKTAGVYFLGTIEGARGKGLGSFLTAYSTNVAFKMGADRVVLQASLVGEPIYKKMGYETFTHYRWYKIEK